MTLYGTHGASQHFLAALDALELSTWKTGCPGSADLFQRLSFHKNNALYSGPASSSGHSVATNCESPSRLVAARLTSNQAGISSSMGELDERPRRIGSRRAPWEHFQKETHVADSTVIEGKDAKVVDLDCKHFESCSGCLLASQLDQPPILNDARAFFLKRGVQNFRLTTGDVHEWRCRAKLAVRGQAGAPQVGLFTAGSHEVVDIPSCAAHHPALNAAAQLVREAMQELGVSSYDEASGSGSLRYIQMVLTTHNTALPTSERYLQGKVQLTLVWNARDENSVQAQSLLPLAQAVWRRGGARSANPVLHSVWANFQTTQSNIILGGRWRCLLGEQNFWERISDVDVAFTPASFGQANYKAYGMLLESLQKHVPRGSSVTELYAGVGAIGLTLPSSRRCRRVRCVEVNPTCEAPFKQSLQRLPPPQAAAMSWHCADANQAPMRWLAGANVVIVDPPRKGLDPEVIVALQVASLRARGKGQPASAATPPKPRVEKRPWILRAEIGAPAPTAPMGEVGDEWPDTVIYVSCGWASFKEDCAALEEHAAWHLAEAEAFQFFPGTDSMEVLAVFKRGSKSSTKSKNSASHKKKKK